MDETTVLKRTRSSKMHEEDIHELPSAKIKKEAVKETIHYSSTIRYNARAASDFQALEEIENLQGKRIQLVGSLISDPVEIGANSSEVIIPVSVSLTNVQAAGSNLSVQYNNNGLLGGISTITWNGSQLSLGANSNISITGGINGQVLSTNGSGGLSWQTPSSGISNTSIRAQAMTMSILLGG